MSLRAMALCLAGCLACSSSSAGPALVLDGGLPADADGGRAQDAGRLHVVAFSKTAGYRHDSIDAATRALAQIATQHDAMFEATEDASVLVSKLSTADVVVFLMTTGDVLDDAQQSEVERYISGGGGFVGVHSSADTEYDWPYYRDLNGAWFAAHPEIQPASVIVDAPDHPLVSFLPRTWMRTDEWYNFKDNPRTRGVTVLLRLDESTYQGGSHGDDHPIAWAHSLGAGRAFYTGLGHTRESWEEPQFLKHIELGLLWSAGR